MNGNLKKMREKRNEIIAAMEAVVNAAAAEERSLTDDEITAYNGRRDELTRIDATIAALENVRSAERNEEHQPEGDEKLTPEERSFVSFLRGEIRVDVNTTKTNAGAVIPTTVADRIVEYVKNVSPIAEYATRYEGIGKITIGFPRTCGGDPVPTAGTKAPRQFSPHLRGVIPLCGLRQPP